MRRLNLMPVRFRPPFEGHKRLFEGSAEVSKFVEGGGVEAAGVDVSRDESVPFRPSKRVGEDFVGHTVERVIEFLVAATPLPQLSEDGDGPSAVDDTDDAQKRIPTGRHQLKCPSALEGDAQVRSGDGRGVGGQITAPSPRKLRISLSAVSKGQFLCV